MAGDAYRKQAQRCGRPEAERRQMTPPGFLMFPGYLSEAAQQALVRTALRAVEFGPFYRAITPSGRPMSVEMTNFRRGWAGSPTHAATRYERRHPATGRPWPPMPAALLDLWRDLSGASADPDCCLVNRYSGAARMGLHQDRDEADFSFPVLSVSLGDTAVFRLGGATRRATSGTLRLSSGDVCLLGGDARPRLPRGGPLCSRGLLTTNPGWREIEPHVATGGPGLKIRALFDSPGRREDDNRPEEDTDGHAYASGRLQSRGSLHLILRRGVASGLLLRLRGGGGLRPR